MPRTNPPAPAVTGPVIRLTVGILSDGQQFQIILDYMGAAFIGINTAALQTFLTNWQANAQATWLLTLAADAQINLYTVAEVSLGVAPTLVAPQTGLVGTNMTDSYPGILSAVGTKYTPLKGQHGRGRASFGPVALNDIAVAVDANKLTAAAITRFNNLTTKLLMPVVVAGVNFTLSVTTRPRAPLTLTANGVPASSMVMDQVVGTIRRRKFGRGI